jgi:hypothetical protein
VTAYATVTPQPVHRVSVVCTDWHANPRAWVGMCWCDGYKTDRLPTPEAAAERASAHVKVKTKGQR